ncbi:MAG: DNA-directed DNA polymerase, partial [Candidatus Nanoarchaeia archaeon]|nr:DNA-directed DNA polymerase [Candidatus Nanoarchaeia archaeon]
MQIQFIPIDYDYFDWQEKNYAKIIGRDDKGKRICIIDSFEPYFWAVLKPKTCDLKIKQIREKIEKIEVNDKLRKSRVIRTELHDKKFLGQDVNAIKIFITNYKDAHSIADEIGMKEVNKRRGYDLGYITQYIIEKKLKPLNWYKIEGEVLTDNDFGNIINSLDVDLCLKVNKITETEKQEFKPKILAYDIEADEFEIGKGEIVMISLVGENFRKVLTWKHCSDQNFVECFKDEADMLEAFVKYVKQYSPDILVGYFSDGFDLPYLRARAEKKSMKLNLGIDNSQPSFSRGRLLTGKIKGIVHIDLLRFIQNAYSQYLQSETLSLNEVSNELLGEKKHEWEHKHSAKVKKHEWEDYFDYNLQDSALTYKLTEKLFPDLMEITKIVGEPLFNVSRSTMAGDFEDLVIHNLERFNEIPEKRPMRDEIGKRMQREKYEGAFVFQPVPGLYENISFFDFTSMYASVIVSYNLSLSTLTKDKKNVYQGELGNKKVYFLKKPGFFPILLGEIIEKRKQYKEEYKKNPNPITKVRSNAYKLIANAAYGYQGFFGARYYCLEAAASTAYFARQNIKQVI